VRFLLEVGVEEMPAELIERALEAYRAAVAAAVAGLAEEDQVEVTATPRRLVAEVEGVAAEEPRRQVRVRGPAVARAREADGSWSRAVQGFAAAQRVAPEDLTEEGGYLYALRTEGGRDSRTVLAERLPGALAGLRFPRSMRWGVSSPRFIRPVRWLVALLDDEVVPFRFAGVASGRQTRGLRYSSQAVIVVEAAQVYRRRLAEAGVVVDREERRARIRALVEEAAAGDEPVLPEALLAECTDLTEHPSVLRGSFPEAFLDLPEPVLATTMMHHQRFIPLRRQGRAVNAFLAVANGGDPEVVRPGNERVLRARLADAAFFFEQDRRQPLASFLPALDDITYLEGAGTLGQRAERLSALAREVARQLGADESAVAAAARAGLLAEADRATQMVRELPELAGVMGGIYAEASGEAPEVALAIRESILPPTSGEPLPESPCGRAVALAARLDHLAAGFVAGVVPKGSSDPYGLRRAAIALLRILAASPLALDPLMGLALAAFGRQDLLSDVQEFLRGRLEGLLTEAGVRREVAEATLAVGFSDVRQAWRRAQALERALQEDPEGFAALLTVFRRAATLAQEGPVAAVGPAEAELLTAIQAAERGIEAAGEDWRQVLAVLADLRTPLDAFFTAVLVMDPDPTVQARRRGLLHSVVALTRRVADFGSIPGDAVGAVR
jgi:glycyl-tRNA synthetase beta chain